MNPTPVAVVIAFLVATAPCFAEDARPAAAVTQPTPAATEPAAAPATLAGEPNVQHKVIEDKGSRIEELKVRGATQRVTVTPKVGPAKSYEIIMGDGSRNLTDSANSSRGAAGQRVWTVLDF